MPSTTPPIFTDDTIRFLERLAANNTREWFDQHRGEYESAVREPARAFIRTMAPRVEAISAHFLADDRKVGGSLMRVNRDIRFSADKSPYKTNIGIQFRHRHGKDVHAPGLYVHVEPGEAFVGVGLWRPGPGELRRIRDRIASQPSAWQRITGTKRFVERFEVHGESLQRAPQGFDPEHPCIEDLKRKDFIVVAAVPVESVVSAGFPEQVDALLRTGRDYARFLCEAIDVPF